MSCDYGIDNCNHVCPGVCYEASDAILLVSLPFQQAHLWRLGTQRTPSSSVASEQPSNAVPVKFTTYKDSVIRVAGMLWVPTVRPRDILQGPMGSPFSSTLRSEGSRGDQAGEAGPVEP